MRSKKIRLFIREYLKDLNGTAAAIRAGYSEKTAHSIASELLTKTEIREEIERLMQERQKRLCIEADEIVQHIAQIAFATPEDFGRWADYSPRVSDKIRALELLARHITDNGDPAAIEQSREILKQFRAKEIGVRDAAIDFAILGLPLPDVIRIELQKQKEPDAPPPTWKVISDEELDRNTADAMAKALAWKDADLPKRREEVVRLEQELTGDNPKLKGN